jgi:hypothetical protein
MAWPTTFANLAGGNQPLSIFDVMFAQVAQMIAIPCTASGQNAITLTPVGNAPILASYSFGNFFRFLAVQTSNAAVTAQFTTLGFAPVYKADGLTQVGTGDINQGQEYVLIYNPALNASAGGFFLENAAVPAAVTTAGGAISGLVIKNNAGTPNTQVDVSAVELVLNNASGAPLRTLNAAFTINFALTGVVNGLDTGAIAIDKDYFIWAISNGSTIGGLASLSSTVGGLNLPGGYTFTKRIGCVKTAHASAQLFGGIQNGRSFSYQVGLAQTPNIRQISAAVTGSVTVPTYTAFTVTGNGNAVPTTAAKIKLMLSNTAGGTAAQAIVAPNANYGPISSTTNPAPMQIDTQGAPGFNLGVHLPGEFVLEGASIGYASDSTTNSLWCTGWEDNI